MTDHDGTTETIGSAQLQAMIALWQSATEMHIPDDREALTATWRSARDLQAAMKRALAPCDTLDYCGSTCELAYNLYRDADAYFACIETIAMEAARRARDSIVFDEDGVGWYPSYPIKNPTDREMVTGTYREET